jgi:hypothetical protein
MTPAQLAGTTAARYLALRARLADPAVSRLDVPEDAAPGFWAWYAGWRGSGGPRVRVTAAEGGGFPEPDGRVALWASQGMGSAYTLSQIAHLSPEVLRYESFSETAEPLRAGAPLAFVLAVLGAQHGFSVSYAGAIDPGALGARNRAGVISPEDGTEFRSAWNQYHPGHRMRSVCEGLTRERVLALLPPGAEAGLSSCDQEPGGWCRDCPKCFESYYAAKAVGRSLGFRLSLRIFDRIYTQAYRTYLKSEFASDPGNSLQYYVYLQMSYGLVFDQAEDTELPPTPKCIQDDNGTAHRNRS